MVSLRSTHALVRHMSLVRPAARALASTSSQSCGARSLARAFSTSREASDDTVRDKSADAVGGIRARPISLKKAAEAAGSTETLIAQALERTSRPPVSATERRPTAGAGAGQAPRAPGMHREELQRLLAERKAAAARGIKESALRGPGAGGLGGPRFGGPRPGGPGGPGGARFGGPRRGGQGAGPGGAPNPYAPVRRPPRKSFKPRFERVVSEYKPPWTKEELTPRKPPATVDTPKLELDALVAADTYVRNSIAEQICKEVKLKPFSSNPKERAAAEKIFQGDYSQWLVQVPGKGKTGKEEVLARVMEGLLHNPSVSFARRQEFVAKMRESMPQ